MMMHINVMIIMVRTLLDIWIRNLNELLNM